MGSHEKPRGNPIGYTGHKKMTNLGRLTARIQERIGRKLDGPNIPRTTETLGDLVSNGHIEVMPYLSGNFPLINILDDSTELHVAPRQYRIAKFSDEINGRFIGSYDAFPCQILTIYDPETQLGCLAHIDDLVFGENLSSSLDEIFRNFPNKGNLRVNIFGGEDQPKSTQINREIVAYLKSNHLSCANHFNLGKPRSIGLDLKDGRLFALVGGHVNRMKLEQDFENHIPGKLVRIGDGLDIITLPT